MSSRTEAYLWVRPMVALSLAMFAVWIANLLAHYRVSGLNGAAGKDE
jgi:hypothetical protein